jgi:hypothetical protein
MDKIWYKDEPIQDIPDEDIITEGRHRLNMWRRRAEYNRQYRHSSMNGQPTPPRPMLAVHMWCKGGDEAAAAKWHLRIPSQAIDIPEWEMDGLTEEARAIAAARAPDCDYTTPGPKHIPEGHTYLMRLLDQGFSVFANERGIGANQFICPYVGRWYAHDELAKHRSDTGANHRVSIRTLGRFHPHVGGIDGPVEQPDGGDARDLTYYVRNGYGSLVNSRRNSECNARITYEFRKRLTFVLETTLPGGLYIGDEFCPPDITDRRRVTAQPMSSFTVRQKGCVSVSIPPSPPASPLRAHAHDAISRLRLRRPTEA